MPVIIQPEQVPSLEEENPVLILLWHLGDVLNVTSLLPLLAEKHGRRVTFVTSRPCVELLLENPDIETIVVFDTALPSAVTLDDFRWVTDLGTCYFSRIRTVYNLHAPVDLSVTTTNIVECWAERLGLRVRASELQPVFVPRANMDPLADERDYLVLGNGGATALKHWPIWSWKAFVRMMKARFPSMRLIQLGSAQDPAIDGVDDWRGTTNLTQTYHMLKNAKACVTNDSFLSHFATLAGTKTYVLFGNTSPVIGRPIGKGSCEALGARLFCAPCYRLRCLITLGTTPCLAFPSAKEVFDRVVHGLESTMG
ncbi:glycosyltransferase family 9 protein [Candidatus Nitrospira bockiana]